ncbi:MAG: DUF1573 domain-containing protein [Flavobacteriia bacterium]|nr:DUF1573 domain-containing protein [Flavobacteriia bacterium]
MKPLIFMFLFLNSVFCFSQEAVFSIKKDVFKFPDTNEGVLLEHTFVFVNSGNEPLIVSDYSVGCKCTVVKLPNEPILPGQKGEIKISFDTNGKYGFQNRTIYLMVNTKKKVEKLRFKVTVIPKS